MALASDVQIQIAEAVAELDIAFIVAGMGGVAGTSIAPAVAKILRERPVITIGAAVTPFIFEGQRRQRIALAGTHALCRIMNVVFPISNELLAQSAREGLLPSSSMAMFQRLYRGAILPMTEPGLVNLDAESIRFITSQNEHAAMGYGSACGADADVTAARQAIAHPLLGERRLSSASSILFSVEGPPAALAKLGAVCRIIKTIRNTIGDVDHEQIIFCGAIRNETLVDEFRVTILAGGILAEENY